MRWSLEVRLRSYPVQNTACGARVGTWTLSWESHEEARGRRSLIASIISIGPATTWDFEISSKNRLPIVEREANRGTRAAPAETKTELACVRHVPRNRLRISWMRHVSQNRLRISRMRHVPQNRPHISRIRHVPQNRLHIFRLVPRHYQRPVLCHLAVKNPTVRGRFLPGDPSNRRFSMSQATLPLLINPTLPPTIGSTPHLPLPNYSFLV